MTNPEVTEENIQYTGYQKTNLKKVSICYLVKISKLIKGVSLLEVN